MKEKIKEKLFPCVIAILLLTGAGCLCYPSLSNMLNEKNQSKVIAGYEKAVAELPKWDFTEELEKAKAHNALLAAAGSLGAAVYMEKQDDFQTYHSLLNVADDGVMAVIRIPKVKISLPVYHTTEDTVLNAGAGHYPGSSLPVGGENTHCIITGHRGLPSAKLFTDLDQLETGDLFYIDVLGEKLCYEVDRIDTVLPTIVEELNTVEGEDFVTLVTCTPYGLNTHRLLIRGRRRAYVPEKEAENVSEKPAQVQPEENSLRDRNEKLILFAILVIAAAAAGGTYAGKRRTEKKEEKEE